MTPTPLLMPRRPRGYRAPGLVVLVDERWCWAWPDLGDVAIPRPASTYLDELARAGAITAERGVVAVATAA